MQLFVKDLTVIDFSYLCPKRGMVGESWIVDVVLEGGLDEQNMVLDFAKVNGAIGIGPSAALTHGGDQSYSDLIQPWMNTEAHERGLLVHAYTLDEPVDFKKAMTAGVDGIFTNRPRELLNYYQRVTAQTVKQVLEQNGY